MKAAVLIAIIILISSCSYGPVDMISESVIITLFEEIHETIDYEADIDIHGKYEYWQSPEETLVIGTGDCEDYVILFMSKLHDMGIDSEFGVISYVKRFGIGYHAVAVVGGVFYDPTMGRHGTVEEICLWAESYSYLYALSYAYVMAVSSNLGTKKIEDFQTGGQSWEQI